MKWRRLWMAMLMLVVVMAACGPKETGGATPGGDTGPAESEETGEEPGSDEDTGQAEQPGADDAGDDEDDTGDDDAGDDGDDDSGAAQGGEPFIYSGTGLDALDSYEAHQIVEFEGVDSSGEAVKIYMEMNIAAQRDPLLLSVRNEFDLEGPPGVAMAGMAQAGSGSMHMLITPDKTYMEMAMTGMRTCFASPTVELPVDLESSFDYNVEDFMGEDLPGMILVDPDEVVNGVASAHYRAEGVNNGELTNATIDLWVESGGLYITRIEIVNEGEFEDFGTGTLHVTYEILSVNETVEVTPPQDCLEVDMGDLPEMPQLP